jgi:hypothetical protein
MQQILIARVVNVALRAVRLFRRSAFGSLIDQRPDIPIKRAPIEVSLNELLLYLGANCFQQEAHMPEDRVVTQHGVLTL